MCINFTNLNKTYLKDYFPLPRIDQLINSTSGHMLLSFMDAFSNYNHIRMEPKDEVYTSFIIDFSTYCYKTMMLGLKNTNITYQQLVTKVFKE